MVLVPPRLYVLGILCTALCGQLKSFRGLVALDQADEVGELCAEAFDTLDEYLILRLGYARSAVVVLDSGKLGRHTGVLLLS